MDNGDTGKKAVEEILEKNGQVSMSALKMVIDTMKPAIDKELETVGNTPLKSINNSSFKDELLSAFPIENDSIDPIFLIELLYYFPIEKTNISAGSYDQYLYDLEKTIIDNYSAGNYQVSFFYTHLVFMSYAYYCVDKAYQLKPDRMKDIYYPINSYHGRDDKPDIEHYSNIYDFSKIPEKDIFKVFHIMDMDDATIGQLSSYISSRDDYAHATGKGNISEEEFKQNIRSIIGNMDTLRRLFQQYIKQLYIDFIKTNINIEYKNIEDAFNDFIYDNSLSIKDIEYLSHIGVRNLQNSDDQLKAEYQSTRNIQCAFIEYCQNNYGIFLPDGYLSLRNRKYLYYRYKEHADDFVENELGISAYKCAKAGDVFPVFDCPNCGENQFVFDSDVKVYHCFSCGENYSEQEISSCTKCGKLMLRQDEVSICPECIETAKEEKP